MSLRTIFVLMVLAAVTAAGCKHHRAHRRGHGCCYQPTTCCEPACPCFP